MHRNDDILIAEMSMIVVSVQLLADLCNSSIQVLYNVNLFPNKPFFFFFFLTCLLSKSFENIVGGEKLLIMSNFSFSLSVFYLFDELSTIFIKLESFEESKFVVWERVNETLLSRQIVWLLFAASDSSS